MASANILEKISPIFSADMVKVDKLISSLTFSKVLLIPKVALHVISSGGKRLRPILTIVCARMCGYTGDNHLKLAAAVEFIHTATLLHDDVVDDSKMRRGVVTANNLWGNQASILIGDFLLSRAFQLMVEVGSLDVLKILSDTSAIISEGEIMQMAAEKNIQTKEEDYLEIISAKTAQLFAAACTIGAMISDHDKKSADALFDYGKYLGIAFQIVDDALDYSSRQEQLGKEIGGDFREGKITLPVILAYRKAAGLEKKFWERVMGDGIQHKDDLKQAVEIMASHKILDETIAHAASYAAKGKKALDVFPDSPEKSALIQLIEFSVNRPY